MRVTFLLPEFTFHPGGGPRVVYEYANGLVRRGHTVSVVWMQAPPRDVRGAMRLARREVRNRRTSHRLRRTLTWFDLDPRVRTGYAPWGASPERVASRLPDADVLVSTFWTTWTPVQGAERRKGAPLQLVQSYETWAAPKDTIDRNLREPVPKVVIAPSLERVLLDLGVPNELIHVVPSGVDHAVFQAPTTERPHTPGVAFLVNSSPVKRLDLAVAVVDGVRSRHPDLRAVGFGVEPRPKQLPDWVRYVRQPQRDELARGIFGQAHVFLCTSDHEGWGLPAVEAMSCGCALVSTRNGGVENFAIDGVNALLRPVGDRGALIAAVDELLDDDALRQRLAEQGRATTEQFSWKESVDGFERAAQAALST